MVERSIKMSHMLLYSKKQSLEISHLHYLVSAYESTVEELERLRSDIREALVVAQETGQTQIVDHDRCDFCFHVFPMGQISLMTAIREFDGVVVDGTFDE